MSEREWLKRMEFVDFLSNTALTCDLCKKELRDTTGMIWRPDRAWLSPEAWTKNQKPGHLFFCGFEHWFDYVKEMRERGKQTRNIISQASR